MAAGVSLSAEDIEAFSKKINEYAQKALTEMDMIPKLSLDCELAPEMLNMKTVKMLDFMEPFGAANPKPIFSISNAVVKRLDLIGEAKNHVRMTIEKNGMQFNAVGFRMAWIAEKKKVGDFVSCAFSPEINSFRGEEKVQLMLKDIK